MALTPQDVFQREEDRQISDLVNIIDKKLIDVYSKGEEFVFNFKEETPPHIVHAIIKIYQKAGWNVNILPGKNKCIMALTSYNIIPSVLIGAYVGIDNVHIKAMQPKIDNKLTDDCILVINNRPISLINLLQDLNITKKMIENILEVY